MNRKKLWRRMSVAVCAAVAAVTLTGCRETDAPGENAAVTGQAVETQGAAASQTASGALGRYLEEEMPLPEELVDAYDMKRQEDGSLWLAGVTMDGENYMPALYVLDEGSPEWEKREIDFGEINIYGARISGQGELFIQGFSETEMESGESAKMAYFYIDRDGKTQQVTMECMADPDDFFQDFVYTKEGQILGCSLMTGEITLSDAATGKIIRTYETPAEHFSMLREMNGQVWAIGAGALTVYDLETGEQKTASETVREELLSKSENTEITSTMDVPMLFLEDGSGGSFFCTHEGLYHLAAGGSVLEQLMDGSLNMLGSPAVSFKAMQQGADGSFWILVSAEGGVKLLKYAYSADTPAVPEKELRIYSLRDDDKVRQAILTFQKEHPDYVVRFETGITGDDAVTPSDALRTLNTDLLAGNGPDVLLLDGMNIEDYIEKGLLADLSDTVAQVREQEGFFENVVGAYTENGAFYAVPARFRLAALQGSAGWLDGVDSLTALADRAEQLHREYPEEAESFLATGHNVTWMLQRFYSAYSAGFKAEDGSVNEAAIREFVAQTKRCFEVNDLSAAYDGAAAFDLNELWTDKYDPTGIGEYWYKFAEQGDPKLGIGTFGDTMSILDLEVMREQWDAEFSVIDAGKGAVFLPMAVVGVNAMSSHADAAKMLASYLLSEEAQSIQMDVGFPVNRMAYQKMMTELMTEKVRTTGVTSMDDGETLLQIETRPITQEEADEISAMAEAAAVPVWDDLTVESLVIEQTGNYLMGNISEEEAVDAIIQKIGLYQAE